MKASEVREKTSQELEKELIELKSELRNLIFAHAMSKLSNFMLLKTTKKKIAVIKTILRERELNSSI